MICFVLFKTLIVYLKKKLSKIFDTVFEYLCFSSIYKECINTQKVLNIINIIICIYNISVQY